MSNNKLDNLKDRRYPFKVPDNYFESFEERLLNKIEDKKPEESDIIKKPVKKVSLISPWIGMAAAFLIIAIIYSQLPHMIFPERMPEKTEHTFDNNKYISPADLFNEQELMDILTQYEGEIEIVHDSTLFKDLDTEDFISLTYY
ncbi:hypothetical protein QA597_09980 [Marinilabiliaceae bacterium ANBcel2]|nr:hypothetical protein [Marinilabiliaceae bacterium ANBcel2]